MRPPAGDGSVSGEVIGVAEQLVERDAAVAVGEQPHVERDAVGVGGASATPTPAAAVMMIELDPEHDPVTLELARGNAVSADHGVDRLAFTYVVEKWHPQKQLVLGTEIHGARRDADVIQLALYDAHQTQYDPDVWLIDTVLEFHLRYRDVVGVSRCESLSPCILRTC